MANLLVKDGIGASKYIAATGDGTDADPLVLIRDVSAKELLVDPGTPITWKDSGGTAVITTLNLGFGAGRVGAMYDKGAGAQRAWAHVHIAVQFDTAPAVGDVVELYMLSHDGTNIPGSVGAVDAAVTVATKRNNFHSPLIVVTAEAATADLTFEASGFAYLPMRYLSPVVWNAAVADNLSNHANLSAIITVTWLADTIE